MHMDTKYLEQGGVGVEGMDQQELCELLYGEMTGFSFLTRYLYREDVEEININQWRDVNGIPCPCSAARQFHVCSILPA